MNRTFGLAIVVVGLAVSMGTQANTSGAGNLRVTGTIKPAACTVNLGATGGTVDYGTINASSIPLTSFYPLPEKSLPLNVNCGAAAAQMALSVTDSQTNSVVRGILGTGFTDNHNFGLGAVGTRNTGGYSIRLATLTTVGATLYPLRRTSSGGAWSTSDGKVEKSPYQHSWSRNNNTTPAAVSSVTGTLVVKAVINRGDALDLSRDIQLNGAATLVVTRI